MSAKGEIPVDQRSVVTMRELRSAFELLMNHLEQRGVTSISIHQDYYWSIPREQLYDPASVPQNMDIGQISEDISFLKTMMEDDDPVGVGFLWLSSILRLVGEQFPE